MATTTNYSWTTPNDTDLVKDGASAIRTLGSAIDTTTKALNPSTTLGDIEYRSSTANTNTRLPIGTNGQILGVSAGVPAWINNDVGDITAITATSPLTGGGTTGDITVGIQDGTTAQKGAVQLEDSTSSTSTTKAATPNSVKSAYDLANGAVAKSVIDAKGDLLVGSADNTVARLAVGTNDYVLTADSAATNGVKWAAAVSGALTKITSGSFSAQSSVAVDSCFSSTYTRYLINYTITTVSSAGIDLQFQWRYAGPTTQTSDYYGIVVPTQRGASSTNTVSENAAQLTLCNNLQASPEYTAGMINVDRVGNSSDNPLLWGNGFWGYYTGFMNYGGYNNVARTYTGFLLKTDSGTMTGTYSVYGVSN